MFHQLEYIEIWNLLISKGFKYWISYSYQMRGFISNNAILDDISDI